MFGTDNLRASCVPCNSAKRNQQLAQRAKKYENGLQAW